MDRNSAIGLTLIAALLMVYFYWFAPEPAPAPETAPSQIAQPQQSESGKQVVTPVDSTTLAQTYGSLSTFAQGNEELKVVETEDLRVSFSNKGGFIKSVELKKYKTYTQKPLFLITPERSTFDLVTKYQGKDIDLYELFYQMAESKKGDSTILDFTVKLSNGAYLTHSYSIPARGYEIAYSIKQKGLAEELGGETLTFRWIDKVQSLEKDLQDTRNNTTVNYFTANEGFEDLDERSTSDSEIIQQPVKWVAIKQKFFLASIIAKNTFSGAELATATPADSSIVEEQSLKLFIPKSQLIEGKSNFKFYIGPNDYQEIDVVAEKFEKNVYLGWPPVFWINKFVIFPVFHLLTKFIGNYGLIIIILVILLKLVLAPLSYKSYLSMAKMKVLKPDLDVIKEKHGDDMAKVQQEQLKLYQQVGVNPISGCIPVLLQMPILFAMFYLFPASIELRQQPFLWAEDLSTYDSLITLPFTIPFGVGNHLSLFTLLMTVSTLVYTWQNNQLSSVQGPMKSMSYIMPVIFFFVLNSFSAGLTFYYFVSNLVTFAQQAIIRRFVDDNKIKLLLEENRKKNAAGGGKKSKFMSRLEDAMKASEEARKKAEDERKKKK